MHPRGMVDLACATSATPRPAALRDDSLHLSVSRDGSFFIPGNNYFPGSRVSRNDLPRVLRSMMQPEVEHRVYVSADARAKYSDVEGALTPSETPAFQTSHWWSSKDRARNTDNRA
jgi:biopolymer transport protein ExbD